MSFQAVKWALDIRRLRAPVKLVLVALADRADASGGNCHPGLSELASRSSLSRRRVIAAIAELEEIGALKVHRSTAKGGKERLVNRYNLAVGREIVVPAAKAAAMAEKGTTLVPRGNHPSSPVGTVTTTEPSGNHHSEPYGSACFAGEPRHEGLASLKIEGSDKPEWSLVDKAMISAAAASGLNADDLMGTIGNYRVELIDRALAGDQRAKAQFRTLWFAILAGNAPELLDRT